MIEFTLRRVTGCAGAWANRAPPRACRSPRCHSTRRRWSIRTVRGFRSQRRGAGCGGPRSAFASCAHPRQSAGAASTTRSRGGAPPLGGSGPRAMELGRLVRHRGVDRFVLAKPNAPNVRDRGVSASSRHRSRRTRPTDTPERRSATAWDYPNRMSHASSGTRCVSSGVNTQPQLVEKMRGFPPSGHRTSVLAASELIAGPLYP